MDSDCHRTTQVLENNRPGPFAKKLEILREKELTRHHEHESGNQTRTDFSLVSSRGLHRRPVSAGPSTRVHVPGLARPFYCGRHGRSTIQQIVWVEGRPREDGPDPRKRPVKDGGCRPVGREPRLKKGAEWGLVPGQQVTEEVQRDLEAVIAASPWSAHRILSLLGVSEASYYRRKQRTVWQHGGGRRPLAIASITAILDTARRHTEYGYRQVHAALQWEHPDVHVASISVYRVLNRHGLLGPRTSQKPPRARRPWIRFERAHPHELWQTDVSYWYIEGWGYYYLHTVLDDHSRYIITSRLERTYGADDGVKMLDAALAAVPTAQRKGLELLADHGVTYTADRFRRACETEGIKLIFGSVAHPPLTG